MGIIRHASTEDMRVQRCLLICSPHITPASSGFSTKMTLSFRAPDWSRVASSPLGNENKHGQKKNIPPHVRLVVGQAYACCLSIHFCRLSSAYQVLLVPALSSSRRMCLQHPAFASENRPRVRGNSMMDNAHDD